MVGRPSKYNESKNAGIIELMSEGASIVEVAGYLGVARSTVYEWCDPDSQHFIPEFSDTIKIGLVASQIWWEKQGRQNLGSKDFNSTLWIMNVKNRFREDWSDTHKIDHTSNGKTIDIKPIQFIGSDEAE